MQGFRSIFNKVDIISLLTKKTLLIQLVLIPYQSPGVTNVRASPVAHTSASLSLHLLASVARKNWLLRDSQCTPVFVCLLLVNNKSTRMVQQWGLDLLCKHVCLVIQQIRGWNTEQQDQNCYTVAGWIKVYLCIGLDFKSCESEFQIRDKCASNYTWRD